MNDVFKAPSPGAVARLIERHPLAWVTSPDSDPVMATPLPLLGNYDERGELASLTGHIARRNPHCALLERGGRVEILFQGPQGYLSPEWQGNPSWGPTWNYAVIQVAARIEMQPENADTALRRLVRAMEGRHGGRWSVEQMGARYGELSRQVVAFEARAVSVRARFKMAQDEKVDTLRQFLSALQGTDLAECMADCNKERL